VIPQSVTNLVVFSGASIPALLTYKPQVNGVDFEGPGPCGYNHITEREKSGYPIKKPFFLGKPRNILGNALLINKTYLYYQIQ
jgi:hypothetical protein